jgi:protein tyrosine phosphatase (PTP) superfamily phosphohydrolase (DUF442 family)
MRKPGKHDPPIRYRQAFLDDAFRLPWAIRNSATFPPGKDAVMPPMLRSLLIVGTMVLLLGAPWTYAHYREHQVPQFHVVEDGVLYRSGQPTLAGLERIVHDHGIRTVICLRDGEREDDREEEHFCKEAGLNHFRIQQRPWLGPQGQIPAEIGLREFRQIMNDSSYYPVLIHCNAGIRRTGAYCAVYRMTYQGWSNAEAIAEMKRLGYEEIEEHWDLHSYLQNYRPAFPHLSCPLSHRRQP